VKSRAAHPPSGLWRLAAPAAVTGGAAWAVKAVVTLATGDEPPGAFAVGLALLPFALLGLWWLVRGSNTRAARIGGALSAAAAASVVVAIVVRVVGGADVEGGEGEVTALTPFVAMAGFGTVAALVALGLVARRTAALGRSLSSLPLAMGLAALPLLLAGGALETLDERLLEVPIALLGIGWIGLGAAMWSAAEQP
jgi:hypothetical protein